jgi:hypothetical protein
LRVAINAFFFVRSMFPNAVYHNRAAAQHATHQVIMSAAMARDLHEEVEFDAPVPDWAQQAPYDRQMDRSVENMNLHLMRVGMDAEMKRAMNRATDAGNRNSNLGMEDRSMPMDMDMGNDTASMNNNTNIGIDDTSMENPTIGSILFGNCAASKVAYQGVSSTMSADANADIYANMDRSMGMASGSEGRLGNENYTPNLFPQPNFAGPYNPFLPPPVHQDEDEDEIVYNDQWPRRFSLTAPSSQSDASERNEPVQVPSQPGPHCRRNPHRIKKATTACMAEWRLADADTWWSMVESEDEGDEEAPVAATEDTFNTLDSDHDRHLLLTITTGLGTKVPGLAFPRKLQEAGFGEVCLAEPRGGDLDNHVHPIFGQESWIGEEYYGKGRVDPSNFLWMRLQPALRLASKFITDENMAEWWVRMLLGRRCKDKKTGRMYLSHPGDKGTEGVKRVATRFRHMVQRVRWCFADHFDDDVPVMAVCDGRIQYHQPDLNGSHTHGLTCQDWRSLKLLASSTAAKIEAQTGPEPARNIPIVINGSYRSFFLSESYDMEKAPCLALRTSFLLAVVMVHELAHAFSACKSSHSTLEEAFHDVYDSNHPELGFSWERSVLGHGQLQWIINGKYGALAPTFHPSVFDKRNMMYRDAPFMYPLDPHWIQSFFLKKTWLALQLNPEKKTFWHPPRPNVALAKASKIKGGCAYDWIWVSADFPDNHRLSIHYWEVHWQEWLKRWGHYRDVVLDDERREEKDPDFDPKARKPQRRRKKTRCGTL